MLKNYIKEYSTFKSFLKSVSEIYLLLKLTSMAEAPRSRWFYKVARNGDFCINTTVATTFVCKSKLEFLSVWVSFLS